MASVLAPLSLDWRFRSVCCRPVFQISVWWYVADDAVSPCLMEVFPLWWWWRLVVVHASHWMYAFFIFVSWSHSECVEFYVCFPSRRLYRAVWWCAAALFPSFFLEGVCEGESGCFLIFEPTVAVMEVHGGPWRFIGCHTVSGCGSESRYKPQLMREFRFPLICHLCWFRLCFPDGSEGLVWFAPLSFVSCAVPIMLWDATICSYVAQNCFLFSLFVIVVVCPLTVLPLGRCPTTSGIAAHGALLVFVSSIRKYSLNTKRCWNICHFVILII